MVRARKAAGLTQHALALRLKKPQSFVAKYEGGERRLDVVEFVAVARALGADPLKLMADFVAGGGEKPAKPKRPARETKLLKSRPFIGKPPVTRCSGSPAQSHKIAQDLLDFPRVRSVCGATPKGSHHGPGHDRSRNRILLTEIHSKLNEAARIAKAAEACALAGSIAEGRNRFDGHRTADL